MASAGAWPCGVPLALHVSCSWREFHGGLPSVGTPNLSVHARLPLLYFCNGACPLSKVPLASARPGKCRRPRAQLQLSHKFRLSSEQLSSRPRSDGAVLTNKYSSVALLRRIVGCQPVCVYFESYQQALILPPEIYLLVRME